MDDYVRTFFWGIQWYKCRIYSVADNHTNISYREVLNQHGKESEPNLIIGFENANASTNIKRITEIIAEYSENPNVIGFFFDSFNLKKVRKVKKVFTKFGYTGGQEVGVNMNYFISYVQLSSENAVNMERFLFGMNLVVAWKDRVKTLLKKVLIMFGRSEMLYDKFFLLVKKNNS